MFIYGRYSLKYLKTFLGFIIALASLYVVFEKTNFVAISQIISSIRLSHLICALFFVSFSVLLKSLRWQLLLKFFTTFDLKDVFVSFSMGNMMNMLLPFRSGDLVKVFALSQKRNISKASILGTVVYEHILDFLALSLVFCVALLTYDFPISRWNKFPIFFLTLGCSFFLMCIFSFKEQIQKIKSWATNLPNDNQKLYMRLFRYFIKHVLANISLYYSCRDSLKIFTYTLLIWFINGCWLYFLFLSFNESFHYQFGIGEVSVLLLAMSLAVMVPSAPSYIGTLHLATVIVLRPTGIPRDLIISYAILIHATGTFVAIAMGFLSWISLLKPQGAIFFKNFMSLFNLKLRPDT